MLQVSPAATLIFLLAACEVSEQVPPPAGSAAAGCASEATDSARAICIALDTLARGERLPARLWRFTMEGDTFRIITVPADPAVIDGMGVVRVSRRGKVLSVVVTDSAS